MHVILILDGAMPVPVADPFAHCVRPIEELNEAYPLFEQPTRKNAIACEAGLDAIGIVDAVAVENVARLAREIGDLGGAQLHAGGQLVTGDAGAQFGIAGMPTQMLLV